MSAPEMQTRALEVRGINESTREVDFVASTEQRDSYDSVVVQNWRFDRWDANPVVLFAHESRELPIGRGTKRKVEDKQLLIRVQFAPPEVNPKAEQVYRGVLGGFIKGGSVGFYPHSVRFEKQNDTEIMMLDDNELLEFSITPIPANPETLAKLRARALATKTTAADVPSQDTPAEQRGEQETIMADPSNTDTAALKTKLEQRDAEYRVVEKQLADERTARSAVERELDKARADLTAATERATKAEAAIVERDVKALVGDKIAPTEVEEMLELAKANRGLFDRIIAKRAPMGLTKSGSVLPTEGDPLKQRDIGPANVDDMFNDFSKSLS